MRGSAELAQAERITAATRNCVVRGGWKDGVGSGPAGLACLVGTLPARNSGRRAACVLTLRKPSSFRLACHHLQRSPGSRRHSRWSRRPRGSRRRRYDGACGRKVRGGYVVGGRRLGFVVGCGPSVGWASPREATDRPGSLGRLRSEALTWVGYSFGIVKCGIWDFLDPKNLCSGSGIVIL